MKNPLHQRCTEIVRLLSLGKRVKEISYELDFPQHLICQDIMEARRTVQVRSAAALVARSLREGWIK